MSRQTLNPAALARLFVKQFKLCQVKERETIALLSDQNTRRDYVLSAFAAAEELGASTFEVCIPTPTDLSRIEYQSPAESPAVLQALKAGHLVCTFFPPNLSGWLKELQRSGARILSIIASPDQLAKLMSRPALKKAVLYAGERYRSARRIRHK